MNCNCLKGFFSFDPNKLVLLNAKYTLQSEDEQVILVSLFPILLKHTELDVADKLSFDQDCRTINSLIIATNTFNPWNIGYD